MSGHQTEDDILALFANDGRRPSPAKRIGYFMIACLPVLLPVLVHIRLLAMDIFGSLVTVIAGSIATAVALSMAYHNMAFVKSVQIEKSVDPPTKSQFGKSKTVQYQDALSSHTRSINASALMYSVFYNNLLFLPVAILLPVYILKGSVPVEVSLLAGNGAAAAFAWFNSHTALQGMSA